MSEWNIFNKDAFSLSEPFQLKDVQYVEAEKLEPIERASIERLITEQQRSLVRLQTDVLEIRAERNALERQLSTLEEDRGTLQERIRELQATRPSLEPKTVFTNLGTALQEVDDELKGERYRVDDVDFTLKANVIQTDEGVRMHLPSLDEPSASANLSEVSFRLRAPREDAEDERPTYVDVPDLRGVPYEVAARRLAAAELTVGTVERVVDPDARPDTVIEQFPGAFTVAEPEAPIDLVLAAEPEPEPDTDSGSVADEDAAADDEAVSKGEETATEEKSTDSGRRDETDRDDTDAGSDAETEADAERSDTGTSMSDPTEAERMEAFRGAILEIDPERGDAVVDRLHRAGVTDIESLMQVDPDELAAKLSIPAELITALQERLSDDRDPIPLEEISGIGPTYAGRLRDAGVLSVSRLAELDPDRVADIARVSAARAKDWIEQANRMVRES